MTTFRTFTKEVMREVFLSYPVFHEIKIAVIIIYLFIYLFIGSCKRGTKI